MAKTKSYSKKELDEKPKNPVDEEQQSRLDQVLENYNMARDYVSTSYFPVWDDCWKIYNGKRTARSNYEGVADTFVPETFTVVESVLANIAGGKPKFEFYPCYKEQNADTKTLNALMDFYWEQNRMGLKTIPWVRDSITYGTGILFATWGEKGPEVTNVPLKDFFIDPTCMVMDTRGSLGSARYAGFRFLAMKDDLKKVKVMNPETGELEQMYKNLDDIEDMASNKGEPLDKEEKDEFLGSTLGGKAKKKQIECIYYIDYKRLIVVANRKTIIRDEETPFQRPEKQVQSVDDVGNPVTITIPAIDPFLPFAPLRNYIDGSLFYAKGDVEVILDSQEHLNDTANQKIDNLSYINNRMFALDPGYADKIDEIDAIPGAIFTVPPGAFEAIQTQPLGVDADNEMFRVKDEIRRATAADEIIQGAGQDKGKITATEVRAQLAQAGTRFSTKLGILETEGYATLASILFKLVQIHVTQEMAVRVIGPKGLEWKSYNPGEYLGDYDPKVTLDTTARTLKLEDRQKHMEFWQMASQLPFVDQRRLFTETATKVFDLDEDEADALLMQQAPPEGIDPNNVPAGTTMGDLPPEIAAAAMEQADAEAQANAGPAPLGVGDVTNTAGT